MQRYVKVSLNVNNNILAVYFLHGWITIAVRLCDFLTDLPITPMEGQAYKLVKPNRIGNRIYSTKNPQTTFDVAINSNRLAEYILTGNILVNYLFVVL